MEEDTIRIALKKLSDGSADGRVQGPRFGTGGHFSGIFLWDTAFTALWAKYYVDQLPVERSLDNFYRLQEKDGFICREYSADGAPAWPKHHPIAFAPPVLAWAELDLYEQTGNQARLAEVYPHLKKHHQYNVEHFRRDDGLFIGDPWGSGMDNLARWPHGFSGADDHIPLEEKDVHPLLMPFYEKILLKSPGCQWNQQGRYIDMSAQMAFNADCLARIAALVEPEAAQAHIDEHAAISNAINTQCWDEEHQFYFDLGYGERIPRLHIGAYWTLIANVVPQERLAGFIAHLQDPKRFARPVPVPVLAADDPGYRTNGFYWRGSSWPP
ncbi:MAG: hypothetical protein AAF512_12225, partial [Pseudomonadota bacterium]